MVCIIQRYLYISWKILIEKVFSSLRNKFPKIRYFLIWPRWSDPLTPICPLGLFWPNRGFVSWTLSFYCPDRVLISVTLLRPLGLFWPCYVPILLTPLRPSVLFLPNRVSISMIKWFNCERSIRTDLVPRHYVEYVGEVKVLVTLKNNNFNPFASTLPLYGFGNRCDQLVVSWEISLNRLAFCFVDINCYTIYYHPPILRAVNVGKSRPA